VVKRVKKKLGPKPNLVKKLHCLINSISIN
uniref:Uncharacterized protein n=1 Tax=Amphimedon queenslandica TaxID=400682 RepID=A0A1X7UHU5_AMPQE